MLSIIYTLLSTFEWHAVQYCCNYLLRSFMPLSLVRTHPRTRFFSHTYSHSNSFPLGLLLSMAHFDGCFICVHHIRYVLSSCDRIFYLYISFLFFIFYAFSLQPFATCFMFLCPYSLFGYFHDFPKANAPNVILS